jgi:fatty-acyl-CoA synthase
MTQKIVKGCPSTSGDDYQLNTITFIKGAARTYPEVEVVSRRLDGSLLRYNYGDAYKRMQQLANAMVKQGIKAGDRVAVVEWNTHRYWELYHALSGIGAVLLQINLRISEEDKIYVINHSEASHVFVNETLLPLLEPIAGRLETVKKYFVITDKDFSEVKSGLNIVGNYEDMLAAEKPDFDWPMIDETSTFSACYTSGTTGKPKGIYFSHRCIYIHTQSLALSLNMSNRDVLLQTVPMYHCHGWGLYFSACLAGAKLVFPGMYTAETLNVLVDLMISEKVTISQGAPAILIPMLQYLDSLTEKPKFKNLRIASGATEPPLSMMKGFADYGADIVHVYGATETTPIVVSQSLKPSLDDMPETEKWELKKKQGLPSIGIDIRIVDAEDNDLPHDGESVGEILLKGPWILQSYYNDSRTADAFIDGYWRSGDAGYIDKYGYLKIADRFKDVIKSGGEWISSIDLENAIMANPNVAEAAVVGIEHPKYQERPLALVVLKKGKTLTKRDVLDSIGSEFAKWQLPDEVIFVDEIPKTSVGKFSKKDIRARYKDLYTK